MWFIELGLRTYFILKRYRFLTTAIFIASASTVHNSFKIMFKISHFGVIHAMIHAYQCCVFRFWNKILFLLQWDPKVKVNNSSEFFWLVEASQNGRECVVRFVSLPHSVTCNRDKPIMLQRNKSEAWCLLGRERWNTSSDWKKKTVNSNVLSLNLKLFRTNMDIKSVIRDYLLRNYVVNV